MFSPTALCIFSMLFLSLIFSPSFFPALKIELLGKGVAHWQMEHYAYGARRRFVSMPEEETYIYQAKYLIGESTYIFTYNYTWKLTFFIHTAYAYMCWIWGNVGIAFGEWMADIDSLVPMMFFTFLLDPSFHMCVVYGEKYVCTKNLELAKHCALIFPTHFIFLINFSCTTKLFVRLYSQGEFVFACPVDWTKSTYLHFHKRMLLMLRGL